MKRLIALTIVPLAAAAVLVAEGPALPAGATSTFTFYGGGWGHGIGMSQYGAYGMASNGASYTGILAQYYTGTAVQTIVVARQPARGPAAVADGVQLQASAARSRCG